MSKSPTKSKVTKEGNGHDKNLSHSLELHKSDCESYQIAVHKALENRTYSKAPKERFETLLGETPNFADYMPWSDIKVRLEFGKLLISSWARLHTRWKRKPGVFAYWVTFVDEAFLIDDHVGEALVYKLHQKIGNALRYHTKFDAIGIIENQAIINYPKDRTAKSLSLHAHVLCWGPNEDDVKQLVSNAKGFKSKITSKPIHYERVEMTEGSLSRLARYAVKPPLMGKEVNYECLAAGKSCLFPAKRMELHHHLKLFEFNAKLPASQVIFGVRDGSKVVDRIRSGLNAFQKAREGKSLPVRRKAERLFVDFYAENTKLKKFQPMKVLWEKPSIGGK